MSKDIKILIIDDDEMYRQTYSLILSQEGYITSTASDGISGLEKFKTTSSGKKQTAFRPKKIFYYMQTYLFIPTFIVDISDYFQLKMKSVNAFKSQFHNPAIKKEDTFISKPGFLDYVEARARFYGFQIRKKYGEPFYCEEDIEYDFNDLI